MSRIRVTLDSGETEIVTGTKYFDCDKHLIFKDEENKLIVGYSAGQWKKFERIFE